MRAKWLCCLGWSLLFGDLLAQVPAPKPRAETPPLIREFDTDTLARLGRDIYRHDQMAWQATDLVAARIGLERLQAEGAHGWVIDDSGLVPYVRFLRRRDGRLEAACDVQFPLMGKPTVVIPEDRTVTARQAAHSLARETAISRLVEDKLPLCPLAQGSYNFVVLSDPAGRGLLFYFLRPKETMESIPVGGHYRISLTEDGKTVTRVDRLSVSCMTLQRPPEGRAEATWMTHLTSNTPIEIHVFLSLQENLPFFVGTPDKRLWKVSEGAIRLMESPDGTSPASSQSAPGKEK
jgi:hypothetical protein